MEEGNIRSTYDTSAIDQILTQLDKVFEQSNYNMDQFIDGKSLTFEDDKLGDLVADLFKHTCRLIREYEDEIDEQKIFEHRADDAEYQVKKFLRFYKNYIDKELRLFRETKELRKMEIEQFQNTIRFVLHQRMLLDTNKQPDFPEKLEQIAEKLLNGCMECVVTLRFDEEKFCLKIQKIFAFDVCKCQFLYRLIQENRQDIFQYIMMKKLTTITQDIKQLKNR